MEHCLPNLPERAGFNLQDIGIIEGERHVQIQSTDGVLVVDSKGLSRHHERNVLMLTTLTL